MRAVRSKKESKVVVAKPAKKAKQLTKFVALKPRISEKAYALSEKGNTYIFDVTKAANKFDVADAVSAQYDVGVVNVRIAGVVGKKVNSYRRRGRRSISAKRSDVRKAYVTLKEDDKLPIFANEQESEKPKETK